MSRNRKYVQAALSTAIVLSLGVMAAMPSMSEAATKSQAQKDLAHSEAAIQQEAGREIKAAPQKGLNVNVKEIRIVGNSRASESEIRNLLPVLKEGTVSVHTLAQEIQQVNDNGAMKLNADFQPVAGGYRVTVKVDEQKKEHYGLTVSNTGNDFTGDWRATVSFIDTDASHQDDTVGIAYVTSPGHWSDVKQAAFSYKLPNPKDHANWIYNASYSNVDMGNVYSLPGLIDLSASGTSKTAGIHYQKNVTYTSREKDIFDLGVDYKKYTNDYNWNILNTAQNTGYDFHTSTVSLDFMHNDRSAHHAFTYDLGYVQNFDGSKEAYEQATTGSDKNFGYWKGGVSYLLRTKSDWRFSLRLHGQYTDDNLVSTEQLGAGGIYTVRGFNERVLSGDKGYVGNFEIYTPEIAPGSRFLGFFDWGDLTNNNTSSSFHNERLASTGVGYRFDNEWFRLGVDYAYVVDDADDVELTHHQGHQRWNVVATAKF